MPTTVQFRRGTTAQNNAFTGANGEISVDTDDGRLVLHDGSTAGGTRQALASETIFRVVADDSTGIYLQGGTDELRISGGNGVTTSTDSGGSVTISLNGDITTVNTISSADSAAVTIADNANIEGTLQVNSTINAVGNITTAGSFVIGSASINETDLEKIDGITNGAGAANKALVLDGSANVASGLAALTASGVVTAAGFTIGSAVINEADLEQIDDLTAGTVTASKALVVDASKDIGTLGTVTASAMVVETISSADSTSVFFNDGITLSGPIKSDASSQINIDDALDVEGAITSGAITSSGAVTATSFVIGSADINETDLEQIDDLTAGTVTASKAVVVDSNKDVSSFRNLTATGTITTAILDVNSIKSTDSTHIRIDEGLDVVGTLKVQEITSLDSSDVLITNLRVQSIVGDDSSFVNINDGLNVDGNIQTTSGNITAGGSFIIGSADINETDLEKIDGITNGTAAANKAVVLDGSKNIGTLGAVTATSIVLGSADINEADLEQIDGLTAGTVTASKAVVVDSDKDIGDFRNVTLSGTLHTTTLDVREIESTDSTVVTVNEGLEILGTLQVNEIVASDSSEVTINNLRTQVITANDSTEILVNDAMRVSGLITGTATQAQYADLAEIFPTDDTDLEPGDVVDFSGDNKVAKSNQEAHTSVAGVVSTEPGFLLNEGGTGVKLAMTGKVPCKVQGIVNAGDLLVSAGNGKAKSATNPSVGTVIGKAIENHTIDGNGVINIMIVLM